MEDASVVALKLGGEQADPDPVKVQELKNAVVQIAALMDAALSISE